MTLLECAAFMEACRKAEFAEVRDEGIVTAMIGADLSATPLTVESLLESISRMRSVTDWHPEPVILTRK
jgi:hypothetical protein